MMAYSSKPLTPSELADLKATAKAATPGPWQQTTNGPSYLPGWENCASVMQVLRRMWSDDATIATRQDQNHTEQMRKAIEAFKP